MITLGQRTGNLSDSERAALKVHIQNLNEMSFFAENRSVCRRVQLVRYLGEACSSPSLCIRDREASCDNCESNQLFTEKDVSEEAKAVIETVSHLSHQSGKKRDWTLLHYLSIFMGSNSKKLVEEKHTTLPGFGVLKNWKKSDANLLIRKLILERYLKEKVEVNKINRMAIANVFIHTGERCGEFMFSHVKNPVIMLPVTDCHAKVTSTGVRKQTKKGKATTTSSSSSKPFMYFDEEDDTYDPTFDLSFDD